MARTAIAKTSQANEHPFPGEDYATRSKALRSKPSIPRFPPGRHDLRPRRGRTNLPGNVIGKRQRVARALTRLHVDRVTLRARPRTLFVLTYHRVLPEIPDDYPYDEGVAEHTAATFEAQAWWLARHTHVLSEDALLRVVQEPQSLRGPLSVITVDDAYVDAHDVVLPILSRVGLPAIFFVPIEPVQTRRLGWWDLTAYVLKRCRRDRVMFEGRSLEPTRNPQAAIDEVGAWFKRCPVRNVDAMVEDLAHRCEVALPSEDSQARELLTWKQVHDIVSMGMAVGAHTLTHRVLDTLATSERREEVAAPKAILEKETGRRVQSIAFPGAGSRTVARETIGMAAAASYRLAFLPNAGVGDTKTCKPLRIPRIGAPRNLSELRSLVAYPWLMA